MLGTELCIIHIQSYWLTEQTKKNINIQQNQPKTNQVKKKNTKTKLETLDKLKILLIYMVKCATSSPGNTNKLTNKEFLNGIW